MNKKGKFSEVLMSNVVFIILLVVFLVGMLMFVYSKMNGDSVYEDYYAKELVKVVDLAKPGDIVALDVHKATEIAKKNNIADFKEIFSFDNNKNELCVKLSAGKASCYSYFNNVNVGDVWIEYAASVNGASKNLLHFKVSHGEAGEKNA